MIRKLVATLSALAVVWAGSWTLHAQQTAAAMATQVCSACHGPRGNSTSPAFPRLAGQQKDYLVAQLTAFRDRSRGDPMAQAYMWGMASQLSDAMIGNLAEYFSSQKPTPGPKPDPKLAAAGQQIFEQGLPKTDVPACITCHLKGAVGNQTIPRLADQHAEYVVKQLVSLKSQVRADANAQPMHAVTAGLTFDQMLAVAAYVSGLP